MANPILDTLKLSGVTYDLVDNSALHDLDSTVTSGGTNAVNGSGIYNAITAATGALAETIAEELSGKTDTSATTAINDVLTGHTADTSIHFTTGDVATQISNATSGYADAVAYDSGTTTMNFYHGGTGGTVVYSFDASPFLIDGMIDDVRIETVSGTTYLVIDFNTASGKEDIYIPLTDIFNPANYYNKTEIDGIVSGINDDISAVSGDVSTLSGTVTGINNTLTGHTADTTIHVTSSDKSNWSGKQDALVSGTNIKTINGNSILGSGNIEVQTLPTVSGTTLIFS